MEDERGRKKFKHIAISVPVFEEFRRLKLKSRCGTDSTFIDLLLERWRRNL